MKEKSIKPPFLSYGKWTLNSKIAPTRLRKSACLMREPKKVLSLPCLLGCVHLAVWCSLMLVCWAANVVHMIDSGKVWKYETSMDLNMLLLFTAGVKFRICLLHTGSLKEKCFTETFCRSTTNAHWGLQIEVTTKCSLWLRMIGTTVNCFGMCCVREARMPDISSLLLVSAWG